MNKPNDPPTLTPAPTRGQRAFSRLEWMLAMRYLRARRKESVVSVIAVISFLGIMLGVATLIIVMSVMNGFRAELLSKILGIESHIYLAGRDGPVIFPQQQLFDDLAAIPNVKIAMPTLKGQVLASHFDRSVGAQVIGINLDDFRNTPLLGESIELGDLSRFNSRDGVIVGSAMAFNLGLNVGDGITLVAPNGVSTPFGITPRNKTYEVLAIFDVGMYRYNAFNIYLPLREAQAYFNFGEGVGFVEIFLNNPDEVITTREEIVEMLKGAPVQVFDWQRRDLEFVSALEVQQTVMFIILSLIILVAALNIISGMVMLIKDKTRDIAIVRTMGGTQGSILRIFFITGTSIGVAGTFVGYLLGLIVSWNVEPIRLWISDLLNTQLFPPEVYGLTKLVAVVDSTEVTRIVIFSIAMTLVGTIYPAWRAARIDPVEALRYE